MEKENINIDIIKADVSKREEAKRLVQFAINSYEKIDILINNAGIAEYKLFTEETDEDWNRVINNNLYSAFVMCQEVSKNMIQNKNSRQEIPDKHQRTEQHDNILSFTCTRFAKVFVSLCSTRTGAGIIPSGIIPCPLPI